MTGKRVLDESDYKYIQTPNTLLNDMYINSCQYQLLQQFPTVNGFQDTTHGTTLTFSKIKHPFTQILHDGKCHWVTVSTIGCKANEVKYFDSLAGPSVKAKISKQIANLLKTNSNSITIHMMLVQQQLNRADCGVFAIAFAVSLLFG